MYMYMKELEGGKSWMSMLGDCGKDNKTDKGSIGQSVEFFFFLPGPLYVPSLLEYQHIIIHP